MTVVSDAELVETYRECGMSKRATARKLGIPYATLWDNLARIERQSNHGTGETKNIPYPLPLGQRIKGVSTLYDGQNQEVMTWVKTTSETSLEDIIEAIKVSFDEYKGTSESIPVPDHVETDLMNVVPIADLHHGLLAWGEESGEDYDIKIGAQRLKQSLNRLMEQAPPAQTALLLNLGDFFHSDDSKNRTPASGHVLDVDSRYFKIIKTGVQLMLECIDIALKRHRTVLVKNIPGNHDPHASVALTVALSAFYDGNDRVIIDDSPSEFFWHRFGSTLIGAHHGHKLKPERMAMAMADHRPEDWGNSKYRWFLFGHIHHETVKEVGTVRCESFQTLAAKDAYAAGHGYTSGQSLNLITLHEKNGEIGRIRANISK